MNYITSNQTVIDLFDDTATWDNPICGIMGNADYDDFERDWIFRILKLLGLDPAGRLLDAGTGIGRNIPIIKRLGFTNITAVDFSANMVEFFKARYPEIPCCKMDLSDMGEFARDCFDTTFCMYVLLHIVDDENLAAAVSELERVTRGLLIVGQAMDKSYLVNHSTCRVREWVEIDSFFKKKKLKQRIENAYEIPTPDGKKTNKVSFLVYE